MKFKIFAILTGVSILFSVPASAAVLIGFYDFDDGSVSETHDVNAANFSSTIVKSTDSRTAGGSNDTSYGDSSITAGSGNDGFIRITSTAVITLIYSALATDPVQLETLYFDATHTSGSGSHTLSYSVNGGAPVSLTGFTTTLTTASDTATRSYDDFSRSLSNVILNPGQYLTITFSSGSMRLDNVAITGGVVPEPSRVLLSILACILFLRRRRH